jgi:hypothetical protein
VGGGEEVLAGGADAGEENLAGVAVYVSNGVGEAGRGRGGGAADSGVADLDAGWWVLDQSGNGHREGRGGTL